MRIIGRIIVISILALALMVGVCFGFSALSSASYEKEYFAAYNNTAESIAALIRIEVNGKNAEYEAYEQAIKKIDAYDFSAIVVMHADGAVLYSTSDQYRGAYVSTLSSTLENLFFNKKGGTEKLDDTLLVFTSYDTDTEDRIMAVMPQAVHQANVNQSALYWGLQGFFVSLIAVGAVIALVMLIKHRNDYLYRVQPVNNYLLTVKESGKILASSKRFKNEFGRHSLTDCLINEEKSFPITVKSGNALLVELESKEQGEGTKKLVFNATSALNGYKLVGSDVSNFIDKYREDEHSLRIDPYSKLWNHHVLEKDWQDIKDKENAADCLMAFIRVHNKEYFRTLFGDSNLKGVTLKYAEILRQKLDYYGKLFSPDIEEEVLLITNKERKEEFLKRINELVDVLNQPLHTEHQVLLLDIRVGVVLLDSVVKETELATVLLAGQKSIKNTIVNDYTPYYVLRAANFDNTKLDLTTREGIISLMQAGNVDVWFQPQYDTVNNRIVGFEALTRIVGGRAKEITVFDFISAAEQSGMIIELGRFIYTKAMDFAKLVQDMNVTVSVNVSPIQLMHMGFVDTFIQAYRERGIKDNIVDVEIVESTVIYSMKDVIRKLGVLKRNGINAHIDDFGVAYSSMLYIKKLPVSTLKIDKAFIDGIVDDKGDEAIVRHIIMLATSLGMRVIAEGVEYDQQVEVLKTLGCNIIQGYWIGKAMPKEKAYNLIIEKNGIVSNEDNQKDDE